jgi:transcriptional regulator with GAF, ATPase, and Fis domain
VNLESTADDGTEENVSAQIGWASETPAVKHAASFDIEEAVSAHVTLEKRERRGSGPPNIINNSFAQIIGKSPALETVLEQVERVAPAGTTVLVEGETGTGKELIARARYRLSSRCGRPSIKLNCAAIPLDLLESELLGHERGAFTGAIAQKIGRFEMAHKGTLFLDEVGDIPPALQPKFLRELQEQEFERPGSARTQQVNVRLVAATNCNLAEMVKRSEFRSDLYYRLNVFPLKLPPLRAAPRRHPGAGDAFCRNSRPPIGQANQTHCSGNHVCTSGISPIGCEAFSLGSAGNWSRIAGATDCRPLPNSGSGTRRRETVDAGDESRAVEFLAKPFNDDRLGE